MAEEQLNKKLTSSSSDEPIERTSITDFAQLSLDELTAMDRRRPSLSGEEELNTRPLIFDNCWQILERLGEGGMSVVYKARHLELNRVVAIKVLLPHLTCNMKNLQRFRQEAVTASALNHPNLIRVENFGVTPDGRTFIVMDFIEGISLGELIASDGKVDPMRALFIFVQTANALQHAHERNVIHRDLKPNNIMLIPNTDAGESVKIVDFGIAKLVMDDDDQVQHLTQTGEVFGSPLYMSPEQCRGEKLDNRSDIYSMGVLMYETLTGRVPHKGANVLDTMQKQLGEPAEPIVSDKAPDSLLKRLNTIVLKALEKEPALRYQTMQELESDLNNALLTAEKDWRHRAKTLQKTYKKLKPKKRSVAQLIGIYLAGILVCTAGYFGVKELMFDPLTVMNLEQDSLFSRVERPVAKSVDPKDALVAEQLDVVVTRDRPIWNAIKERISSGKKSAEDFDKITNELLPNSIAAAKEYRRTGQWIASVQFYNLALEMLETMAMTDSSEYVTVYMIQGENYLGLGNYRGAYNCFTKALSIAGKTMTSDAKEEIVLKLNYALMRIAVHERKFDQALQQANRISQGFAMMARKRGEMPLVQPEWMALQSEVSDIERLTGSSAAPSHFRNAVKNWKSFIAASIVNDQYEWNEYLAKTQYGLALAEAQNHEFSAAASDMKDAYDFLRKRGKNPELTDRVKGNYLFLLRKTNPVAYLLQSLQS